MLRREQKRHKQEAIILEMVRQIRRRHPRMGTRKLLVKLGPMLAAEGLKMGRDRLFSLLKQVDLLVKRRKRRHRTTISGWWRTANLLPGLTISQPNQVWVSDITYLQTEVQPFVYLFMIMDLFSRYIVGWQVADTLAASGALVALEQAIQQAQLPILGTIHHSDHGVQYTCHNYLNALQLYNIQPSMGEVGNCYENAFAERVIGTLKHEYFLDARLANHSHAYDMSSQSVDLYNLDRPHLSLNYATPASVYFKESFVAPVVIIPAVDEAVVCA